jgi:hypothetical protein
LPLRENLPSTASHGRDRIMGFKYGVNGWKVDAQGWKMSWKV